MNNNSNEMNRIRRAAANKAARNAARINESSYLKGLRPGVREMFGNYRGKRTAGMPASISNAIGGGSAARYGAAHPAAARARSYKAYKAHLKEYSTRAGNRQTARNNIEMYVQILMQKAVANWTPEERELYKKYRSRYRDAVNNLARGGKTTVTFNNTMKRTVTRESKLRGLARLRELGRGTRARLRNKLGMAGVLGRGALSLGRLAGNYGAAGAATGYGAFARGVGAVGAAGYRAGHAAGNYPRAQMLLRGARLPHSGNTKNATANNRRAALNKALNNLRKKQALALANPTRTNVNNANSAARRAARTMVKAGNYVGERAKALRKFAANKSGYTQMAAGLESRRQELKGLLNENLGFQ